MLNKWRGTAQAVPFFNSKKSYLFVLAAGVVSVAFWLSALVLVVTDNRREKIFYYSCGVGDCFQLCLIHSVEKSPWEDNFLVRGAGDLLLITSKFESLGWGYPYSEADGKFSIDKDNKFIMTLNRKFVKINTCVAIQAMPKVIYNNIQLDLCQEFGDGALVEIAVMPRYQLYSDIIFNNGR